jgi:outer membrane protein assembly factor BamB
MRKGTKYVVEFLLMILLLFAVTSCAEKESAEPAKQAGSTNRGPGWSLMVGRKLPQKMILEGNEILIADSVGNILAIEPRDGSHRVAINAGAPIMGWDKKEQLVVSGTIKGLVHLNDITTGAELWSTTCETTPGEPSFTPDGVVFADGINRFRVRHHSLNDGISLWLREFDVKPSGYAPVVNEDAVFVSLEDGTIHALGLTDGETMWEFKVGGPLGLVEGSPYLERYEFLDEEGIERAKFMPIHPGGIGRMLLIEQGLIVPSEDGWVRCFNPRSGEIVWQNKLAKRVIHAWYSERSLLYCEDDRRGFYRIDADNGDVESYASPIYPTNGFVSMDTRLMVDKNSEGKPHWRSVDSLLPVEALDIDFTPIGNVYSDEGIFVVRTSDGRIMDLSDKVF